MSEAKKETEKESHKYDVELNPLPPEKQLSIFGPEYLCDKPVALHLKTKWSWSGDTMSVKDQFDNVWFSVKGDYWSFSETKIVCGKDGKPLFLIGDKAWWNFLDDAQSVWDCRGLDDAKVAKKFKSELKKDKSKLLFHVSSNIGNTKQKATVRNSGAKGVMDEMVDVVGKCTWMNLNCALWRDGDYKTGGIPLAKFMSPIELQNFIDYKSASGDPTQDFYLTVAPGADIAFCLAFVLAIREMDESYT